MELVQHILNQLAIKLTRGTPYFNDEEEEAIHAAAEELRKVLPLNPVFDLDRKLSISEQSEILERLFDFHLDEIGVIHDAEWEEFHGTAENDKHDLSTLRGIFAYQAYKSKADGIWEKQREIKKVLGI